MPRTFPEAAGLARRTAFGRARSLESVDEEDHVIRITVLHLGPRRELARHEEKRHLAPGVTDLQLLARAKGEAMGEICDRYGGDTVWPRRLLPNGERKSFQPSCIRPPAARREGK